MSLQQDRLYVIYGQNLLLINYNMLPLKTDFYGQNHYFNPLKPRVFTVFRLLESVCQPREHSKGQDFIVLDHDGDCGS